MEQSNKSKKQSNKKCPDKDQKSRDDLENFIEIKESQNKVLKKIIENLDNKKEN